MLFSITGNVNSKSSPPPPLLQVWENVQSIVDGFTLGRMGLGICGHGPLFHQAPLSIVQEWTPVRQCAQGLQICTAPQNKFQVIFYFLFSSYTHLYSTSPQTLLLLSFVAVLEAVCQPVSLLSCS